MMKLTVAFLFALAVADARQARREYGNYGSYPVGNGTEPSTTPKETPLASSSPLPYVQSSAEAFSATVPYGAASSYPPKASSAPPAGNYGSGYAVPSSKPVLGGTGYPSKPVLGGTGVPSSSCTDKTPAASSTPVKVATTEYPVSEITKTLTETLVYTVGVGSTAHAVTTEITSTSTQTVYTTVVISKETGKPGYPVGGSDVPEDTTTIKSTTTSTKYITVKPTPTPAAPVGGQGYPAGKPSKESEGECAAPVTVTVTAKQTVTVTKANENKPVATPYGGDKPVEASSKPVVKPSGGAYTPSKPSPPAGGNAYKPSATPSPKYPVGNNGTYPGYPAGPTGFKTSTKPSGPVGTGYHGSPAKPSESAKPSSLPAFSLASEVPYAASTPVKAAESSPVATPSKADYGYGSYGEAPASSPVKTPEASEKPTPSPTPVKGGSYGSGYGY